MKMNDNIVIHVPHLQVRAGYLLQYDEIIREQRLTLPPLFTKKKSYAGIVTAHSARLIKRSVGVLWVSSKERRVFNTVTNKMNTFHAAFITLTISASERVSYPDALAALQMFLQHFKRPWRSGRLSERINKYVWKAELQRRGQIHFHIIVDSFMHYVEIRKVWNRLQERRGWLDDFKAERGHTDANSTDIKRCKSTKSLSAYISKYMSKNDYVDVSEQGFPVPLAPRSVGGKVWGCSENVGRKYYDFELDEETWYNIVNSAGASELVVKELKRCKVYQSSNPEGLLSRSAQAGFAVWQNA